MKQFRYREVVTMKDVNELVEKGYKLHTVLQIPSELFPYLYIMEMSNELYIRNGVDFVIIEPDKNTEDGTPLMRQMISRGWVPIAQYSNRVVLMMEKQENE